jgi:hypothetical protein
MKQTTNHTSPRNPSGDIITYTDARGRVIATEDEDVEGSDEAWPPRRLPTTARRYDVVSPPTSTPSQGHTRYVLHSDQVVPRIPPRATAAPHLSPTPRVTGERATVTPPRRPRGRFRLHPLLWLGVGMLAMLALWMAISALMAWWSVTQDTLRYGYPRTAHYDVVVGHDDSASHPTHLIAMNLHGQVLLIEFPGGQSAKARISTGPQLLGADADRAPVTVRVQDINGDGHPDLLVTVQGTQLLYLNQDVNGVWQFVWQPTSH